MNKVLCYVTSPPPFHILFVVYYVILCIDSFVYGVLSKAVKRKLKLVILIYDGQAFRCL